MALYDIIWHESIWLPTFSTGEKYSWEDLESPAGSNIYYPRSADLHWSLVLGVGLVVFRALLERFIIAPLGYRFGVRRQKPIIVNPSPALETRYRQSPVLTRDDVQVLSKQLDMSVRDIERWWRDRKKLDVATPIKKFCDNCWHLLFYTTMIVYGLLILWDKPWLWNTAACWEGWPKQHVTTDVYRFYLIELAFYWSLVFTLFTDHKRKDFTELMIHHIATLMLIYFSWFTNFVRVGTLVLIAHDAADPWLGMSKMWKYIHRQRLVEISFVIFLVVWILSRLIYYPFWVLHSTITESREVGHIQFCPIYFIFNFLLLTLMLLHILWSYSIYKVFHNAVFNKRLEDVRSDSDEDPPTDQKLNSG